MFPAWMRTQYLTGSARLAGVIGWPIAQSRSPRLHGFWLDRHGIDGAYVPLAVPPDHLAAVVRGLASTNFAGLNVTVPYKQMAVGLCDEVAPFARRVGAVNMLTFREGRITGSNSDGFGFTENLRAHGVDPGAGPALLLGAGGAARAIAAALQDAGAAVTVVNRTRAAADALAADLPGVRVEDWSARWAALDGQALLVNTTTLGMTTMPPLDPDLSRAAAGLAVVDIVYAPLETQLLHVARAAGLRTVGGIGMLLHQARPGFATWFGVEPTVDEALERHVLGRDTRGRDVPGAA